MSSPKSITSTNVWQITDIFVRSINELTESIPASEIYGVKVRLNECANSVPKSLEEGMKQSKRIERIRSLIKANGFLDECKDYLNLINKLKYSDTNNLLSMADEISEVIKQHQYTGIN